LVERHIDVVDVTGSTPVSPTYNTMNYREFLEEGTDSSNLQTTFIETNAYKAIHETTVILCHDVFIRCTYNNTQGILLVKRLTKPAKDIFWPIGGRVLRGISAEESINKKALEECSLNLTGVTYLGTARTFFKDDPFEHNKGTDTLNLVYLADGEGNLKLNEDHTTPLIVTKASYITLRETFVPYVQNFLDTIDARDLW
jgi:ADP-ribose pyrophosphatase YjhB (NUDIX family)